MTESGIDVAGKVALVTGAARGIGRAIALRLAAAGADLAIADLPQSQDGARKVAGEIEALGRKAMACSVDVRDPASVEAMVQTVLAELGRIDVLVNNAGIN